MIFNFQFVFGNRKTQKFRFCVFNLKSKIDWRKGTRIQRQPCERSSPLNSSLARSSPWTGPTILSGNTSWKSSANFFKTFVIRF